MKTRVLLYPLSLCFSFLFTSVFGQDSLLIPRFAIDQSPVIRDFVDARELAWAGGIDNAQFSSLDLNLDGIDDLLIFDRNGHRLLPMLHSGVVGTTNFTYAPEYLSALPAMEGFVLTRDYDRDGDFDLFTFADGGIICYENNSSAWGELHFKPFDQLRKMKSEGDNGGSLPIEVVEFDVPSLSDMDRDGDLDILVFDITGTLLAYHQNISREFFGHDDSLTFILNEGCWGHIQESNTSGIFNQDVFCKTGGRELPPNRQHVGSSVLAIDIDGDGDSEALLGDVGYDKMVLAENGGDSLHAYVDTVYDSYPPSNPIDIDLFPAAFHLDIDQDGARDLIMAPTQVGLSENLRSVGYYLNVGTDRIPNFLFRNNEFLQEDMWDVGSRAYPLLIDYDGDSLMDLVVGNYGYYTQGNFRPQIALFKNFGTDTLPIWELITDDLGQIAFSNRYPAYVPPAMGDLDGDGDLDMLVGRIGGGLDFYINRSSSPTSTFPNLSFESANYQGIDVGGEAQPQLIDVNEDGLIDLLIGNSTGNVHYYQNQGNVQVPSFTLITDNFGQIEVGGNARPFLFTSMGKRFVSVGSHKAGVQLFRFPDNLSATDAFPVVDTLGPGSHAGFYLAPTYADVNGDSLPDLVLGNAAGGMTFLAHLQDSLPSDSTPVTLTTLSQELLVYPNPSNGRVTIEQQGSTQPIQIRLIDMQGRTLTQVQTSQQRFSWDLDEWTDGVYLLAISHPEQGWTYKRLILQTP